MRCRGRPVATIARSRSMRSMAASGSAGVRPAEAGLARRGEAHQLGRGHSPAHRGLDRLQQEGRRHALAARAGVEARARTARGAPPPRARRARTGCAPSPGRRARCGAPARAPRAPRRGGGGRAGPRSGRRAPRGRARTPSGSAAPSRLGSRRRGRGRRRSSPRGRPASPAARGRGPGRRRGSARGRSGPAAPRTRSRRSRDEAVPVDPGVEEVQGRRQEVGPGAFRGERRQVPVEALDEPGEAVVEAEVAVVLEVPLLSLLPRPRQAGAPGVDAADDAGLARRGGPSARG